MARIGKRDFIKALRQNGGCFAQTAAYIRDEMGIEITRQAVRQRALRMPEELNDIEQSTLDIAEGTVISLMAKADRDSVRLRAAELYLTQKGRKRGWTQDPSVVINNEKGDIKAKKLLTLETMDPDLLLKLKQSQEGNKYNSKKKK